MYRQYLYFIIFTVLPKSLKLIITFTDAILLKWGNTIWSTSGLMASWPWLKPTWNTNHWQSSWYWCSKSNVGLPDWIKYTVQLNHCLTLTTAHPNQCSKHPSLVVIRFGSLATLGFYNLTTWFLFAWGSNRLFFIACCTQGSLSKRVSHKRQVTCHMP